MNVYKHLESQSKQTLNIPNIMFFKLAFSFIKLCVFSRDLYAIDNIHRNINKYFKKDTFICFEYTWLDFNNDLDGVTKQKKSSWVRSCLYFQIIKTKLRNKFKF